MRPNSIRYSPNNTLMHVRNIIYGEASYRVLHKKLQDLSFRSLFVPVSSSPYIAMGASHFRHTRPGGVQMSVTPSPRPQAQALSRFELCRLALDLHWRIVRWRIEQGLARSHDL